MDRPQSIVLLLVGILTIGVVATAVAQGPTRDGSGLVAPTLPPSEACPEIEVPRLGPDLRNSGESAIPIAESVLVPEIVAAPSIGPEPCTSPFPAPRDGSPIDPPLPGGNVSPTPDLLPVYPMASRAP